MAQPGKYTVLVMHDNGKTRRYRISTRLLHTLFVLSILLPFVAGAALWYGYSSWQKIRVVETENQTLMEDLAKSEMALHRLSNLETLLATNEPRTLQNMIEGYAPTTPTTGGQSATNPTASNAANTAQTPSTQSENAQGTVAGAPDTTGATGTTGTAGVTENPENPEQPAASAVPPQENTLAEEGTTPPDATAVTGPDIPLENGPVTGKDGERVEINTGLVRVENLSARRVGLRSLRIAFDLYNTEMQPQVSGKTTFDLILEDGTTYSLPPQGDTRFRINRLKRITGNPSLPAEVTNETSLEKAQVRVTVLEGESTIVYQSLVPLENQ